MTTKQGKVIGVVSGKGGVGKTTVCINVGAALALTQPRRKTVLVDCNVGTSHLGVSLGMHYCPHSLNDVLSGKATLAQALYKHGQTGMTVLPSSVKATNIESLDVNQIRKIGEKLSQSYDFVILDAAPGIGREAFATLAAAEELLYVSTPTMPSVLDVVRYTRALHGEKKTHLGIVLNMFDADGHQLSVADAEKFTQLPVISIVPTDKQVSRSLAAELPVVAMDKTCPASKAFFELASKIAGDYKPPEKKPSFKDIIEQHVRKIDEFIGWEKS